jgi:AcrR family transcriptional regulator
LPRKHRQMKKKPTKAKQKVDRSTEEKIKEAARKVFMNKGYSGARTRDIADEAGINLALLNYYFRSKEKLFQMIMFETMAGFITNIKVILSNKETSLAEKTEIIASSYINMLTENPDLPVFILSELRSNPEHLVETAGIRGLFKTGYFKQLKQAAKVTKISPIHYFMNTMGLIVFPFIGRPLIKGVAGITEKEFIKLMQERKELIGKWVNAMLNVK